MIELLPVYHIGRNLQQPDENKKNSRLEYSFMISDFKSHIRTHGYFFYRMYYEQFSSLITQVMQLFSAIIRYLQESLKKA